MTAQPLATFASPDPTGSKRWEWELYPEKLLTREITRALTSESTVLLRKFTTEERRTIWKRPFIVQTDTFRVLCIFAGMGFVCWFPLKASGKIPDESSWVFLALGLCMVLLATVVVGVRRLLHDRSNWTCVEFVYIRDGEASATVAIASKDETSELQTSFLNAVREQIQKINSQLST